ncbi:MAG: flagellar biosynthetic protein FliO [candidate division Zixibacteria bacterium]|jgi:flagellar protein FliO/FliZ|nr:flagellar biosynthetic protein FliO [candidate division Zixibacteria bacterium]
MNSNRNRRSLALVGGILLVAIVGLLVINPGSGQSDRLAPSGSSGHTTVTGDENGQAKPTYTNTVLPSLLRMGAALVLVIACIYGGLYALKRLMSGRRSGDRRSGALEVLETTFVAPKRTVSLVRVADKSVLIGVTDSRISVLTELDARQTAEIMAVQTNRKESDSFKKLLTAASGRVRRISLGRSRAALEG